jgi:tetratricopeptide (TPR) repeat protein
MRILISCICIIFYTNCFSQKNNSSRDLQKSKTEINYDSIVYANARVHSDYTVMMTTIYYMMAKDPQQVIAYKDSLTVIYYFLQAYSKCVRAGNEVLTAQPDNFRIMELVAISERILGNIKTSLGMYEKLYGKTASLIHAYYIAEMQFNMQRYGECMMTLEKIIASENSKREKIELIVNDNSKQIVSLAAAAFNIKGMTYNALGKKEEAKEAFQSAISIEKDFTLPKINLDKADKR